MVGFFGRPVAVSPGNHRRIDSSSQQHSNQASASRSIRLQRGSGERQLVQPSRATGITVLQRFTIVTLGIYLAELNPPATHRDLDGPRSPAFNRPQADPTNRKCIQPAKAEATDVITSGVSLSLIATGMQLRELPNQATLSHAA